MPKRWVKQAFSSNFVGPKKRAVKQDALDLRIGWGQLILYALLLPFFLGSSSGDGFKEEQMRYPRVRNAYDEKEEAMLKLLDRNGIERNSLRVHLRAYKDEEVVELWGKNASDTAYRKLRDYGFCAFSGSLGPKRQQGDRQIPEGFYHIDRFNPASRYHLSLGLNYPNPSDRILGVQGDLGGNIFIHGDCVTIGCIPITDPLIRELYIACVEAKDNGQERIPVHIFPARLNQDVHRMLIEMKQDPPKRLWKDLLRADSLFRKTGLPSRVSFLEDGGHRIRKGSS